MVAGGIDPLVPFDDRADDDEGSEARDEAGNDESGNTGEVEE